MVRGEQDILSDNEKGRTDRFDVQARPANLRLSSELDSGRGREGHRDLGQEKREVSQREQVNTAHGDVRQSHTDGLSDRTQSAGGNDVRHDNRESGERVGRDGRTESTRPNGMGKESQSSPNDSKRTSDERLDLRITEQSNTPKPKAEDTQSPVFFSTITVTNIDELLEDIPENAELPTEDYKVETENEEQPTSEQEILSSNGKQEQEELPKILEQENNHKSPLNKAFDLLRENHQFDEKQMLWIGRIEKVAVNNNGIDLQMFEQGALKNAGGFKNLDSIFNGQLETLIQEINQYANLETVDEQDVIQYTVNFVTQSETYAGGYDSDGHERLDNYSLQQNETSFYIYNDYVSKYDSNLPYGNYDIDTEQAIEEIESLFDKSIYDFGTQMQVTDKDNKPVSINDVLSHLKERTVSVEQENLTDKDNEKSLQHRQAELTREKNKEIIDSLTVGSQIILGENSWKVTHINGDFSANLENLDKNSKMSDLSYMGFWKDGLLDEAKDQPIIVITPEEEKVEQPKEEQEILSSNGKEEQAEVETPLSREELIEKAKSIINDFVNEEYDDTKGADFSDLTKIDVAYTTTEDEKHTIQAYINFEHLNIVKEVDGHILEKESYDSLEKLVDDLNSLDFSDLTSISDEQLKKLEQENLTDKDEQPKRINADDIKIGDKFEYKGKEYEVTHLTGVYPDDVGVSYIEKMAGGLTYQLTSNIDKYTLASQGKYLGNSQQEETQLEQTEQAKDFTISDMALGQTKLSEKFLNNLSAIRTLKQIESENRQATPEEQETLSKYAGWGGLARVFEPNDKYYSEVKELLTEDEFENAKRSTLTAFYTSPVIIKEMYSKLSEMGFDNGKLLEPSCGVGNFIGMIPENMNAKVSGVELDSLTGRMAQKIYPNADIQVCGFENAKLKDNTFDVAVGNVPFGDFKVYDKKYNFNNLLIHDYFFSKSLDMVKSGGIVAFITSKGTLDKLDTTARKLIARKADFLGAVRLPNTAFKSNAGTEVTSDIIFLQKRDKPMTVTPENEPLWIKTAKDENGIEMNAYFVENPQQICGTMVMESTQYGMASLFDTVEVPTVLRNSSYFLSDGKAYFFEVGDLQQVEFAKSKEKQSLERLSGMIAIRDTVRQLLDMQIDERTTDDEIKAVQSTLSSLYDGFVQKHGRLNDVSNTSIFKKDSSLPLLKSLEKTNQKGEFIGKADIFSKRTVKAQKTISSVGNAVDALAVSISEKAGVNLDYMSDLTGMDKGKLIEDLQGSIYKVPNTENYVTADEYLSGDILEKLNAAKVAFDNGDTSMAVNISALEKAMPERLGAADIDVRLGTTWIKPEYIRDFVYDLLQTPSWNKSSYNPKEFIDVQYSEDTGKWNITNKSVNKDNPLSNTTYGTAFKSAYTIIEDMLNLKAQIAKDKVEEDGKVKYVINRERTALLQSKAEKIEQKFEEWIFKDKTRRDDLVNTYNETFNSIRPREYDGSHLNFVGMNPEISLRPHQLNAVARCLYGGNTLLAHEVGAGKTFEMIAACMEGKRLGLHSKSLFCVPNHLTEQIGSDFLKLYPNANILIATKNDFTKENRQKLVAKIATGNYDAVIIGHSQLGMIPVSLERQEKFIRNQIYQLEKGIEELKYSNAENFQVKQLEKAKFRLEEKLKKLLDTRKDEDNVTFEQMGIDKLFLDEAHEFKNLFLSTKMSNVAGITTSDNVQKTADLYMKTQYLDEQTHGKGVVFATGTPISNSMCEMYNMQKYLQGDLLDRKHLSHFDSWATTFGDKVTKLELAPEGNGYRLATRFAKFHNLPELMSMFKECADIQTADTLNLPNLPECEIHNVAVQPTEHQKDLVNSLSERATKVHNRQVEPTVDNMLLITTDGKKIGLDQRLINPDLPDEPHSKVNMCVENVFGIWDKTQAQRSTQLIFCDTSTPKNDGSFNLYDDIKQKLVAKGVPENEIAFIHSANTEDAKEKLFAKVRAGDVRILIGSTKKMGAGTNVQTKLVASHDLDAPYKPSDMEQRRGRMVRQGNENPKVDLYRYCTQDTFDAYLFQMLERKQNFISQVMTSKNPQRRCDDIDEATLSYAEVKALCIGDPRIKEKMELDIDVAKLQLERKAYRDEQFSMEDKVDTLQKRVKGFEMSIPKNENDFLYYENNHQPTFDEKGKRVFEGITINGKTYTERKEANEALKDAYITACRQSGGHKDFVSAHCEYKGFKISVMFNSLLKCYQGQLEREGKYTFDFGTDNIGRMDNMLDKLKEMCKNKVSRCAECKQAIEDINENLGKPFPKEQEFMKKTARLAQLNAELDTDGKKNEMGGLESELGDNLTQGNRPKR